jgi:hypothetical protein
LIAAPSSAHAASALSRLFINTLIRMIPWRFSSVCVPIKSLDHWHERAALYHVSESVCTSSSVKCCLASASSIKWRPS